MSDPIADGFSSCKESYATYSTLKNGLHLAYYLILLGVAHGQLLKQKREVYIKQKLGLLIALPLSEVVYFLSSILVSIIAGAQSFLSKKGWLPVCCQSPDRASTQSCWEEAWLALRILFGKRPEYALLRLEENRELNQTIRESLLRSMIAESAPAIRGLVSENRRHNLGQVEEDMELQEAIRTLLLEAWEGTPERVGFDVEANPLVRMRIMTSVDTASTEVKSSMLSGMSTQVLPLVTALILLVQSICESITIGRRFSAAGSGLAYDAFIVQFCFAGLSISIESLLHACVNIDYPEYDYPDRWYGFFRVTTVTPSVKGKEPSRDEMLGKFSYQLDITKYRICTWFIAAVIMVAFMITYLSSPVSSLQPDGRMTLTDIRRPSLGLPSLSDVPVIMSSDGTVVELTTEECAALWTTATQEFKSNTLAVHSTISVLKTSCLNGTDAHTRGIIFIQMANLLASTMPSFVTPAFYENNFPMSWLQMLSPSADGPPNASSFSDGLELISTPGAQLAFSGPQRTPVIINKSWARLQELSLWTTKINNWILFAQILLLLGAVIDFVRLAAKGDSCWMLPAMDFGRLRIGGQLVEVSIFSPHEEFSVEYASRQGIWIYGSALTFYFYALARDSWVADSLQYATTCPQFWKDGLREYVWTVT